MPRYADDRARLTASGSFWITRSSRAAGDAAHIAVAAANGADYLVTWNFRHIANATMRSRIERACRQAGFEPPVICTPNELMEADHGDDTD